MTVTRGIVMICSVRRASVPDRVGGLVLRHGDGGQVVALGIDDCLSVRGALHHGVGEGGAGY